jgi:hypothetical protein
VVWGAVVVVVAAIDPSPLPPFVRLVMVVAM